MQGIFQSSGCNSFLEQETYCGTLPIIDASGVSSFLFPLNSMDWFYDYNTGHVQSENLLHFNMTSNHLFQKEFNRYINFWNTNFCDLGWVGCGGLVLQFCVSWIQRGYCSTQDQAIRMYSHYMCRFVFDAGFLRLVYMISNHLDTLRTIHILSTNYMIRECWHWYK